MIILDIACRSKSAHVGSSLSCVDILTTLYFDYLDLPENSWKKRDIFILSKAHAAMALYATLSLKGFISYRTLCGYLQNGGTLPAHLDRFSVRRGVEVSAGSLGHGFNIALGMAYGYKLKGDKRKIVTVIGDGESQEGSIWEGALFAPRLMLDNVTAILDYNDLQGYGAPTQICSFEPIADKWKAFGWSVFTVDGHNFSQLQNALRGPSQGKPKMIIARTVKGQGVSFMEGQMKWHYYIVTKDIKDAACKELNGGLDA